MTVRRSFSRAPPTLSSVCRCCAWHSSGLRLPVRKTLRLQRAAPTGDTAGHRKRDRCRPGHAQRQKRRRCAACREVERPIAASARVVPRLRLSRPCWAATARIRRKHRIGPPLVYETRVVGTFFDRVAKALEAGFGNVADTSFAVEEDTAKKSTTTSSAAGKFDRGRQVPAGGGQPRGEIRSPSHSGGPRPAASGLADPTKEARQSRRQVERADGKRGYTRTRHADCSVR